MIHLARAGDYTVPSIPLLREFLGCGYWIDAAQPARLEDATQTGPDHNARSSLDAKYRKLLLAVTSLSVDADGPAGSLSSTPVNEDECPPAACAGA